MSDVKGTVKAQLTEATVTFTYNQALRLFKNEVTNKFPPGSNPTASTRRISEVGGRGGRGGRFGRGRGGRGYGRGRGNGRGYGRGNQGGRGRGGFIHKTRQDSKIITLSNGDKIEYHASFRYPDNIYQLFTGEQKELLHSERTAYCEGQGNNNNDRRQIQQQMRQDIDNLRSIVSDLPSTIGGRNINEMSTGNSIMGGRNEQSNKRLRRSTDSSISSVITTRRIGKMAVSHWQPEAGTYGNNECDTNADTCCFGKNFLILKYTRSP